MKNQRAKNILKFLLFLLSCLLIIILISAAMSELYLKKNPHVAGRLRCVIEIENEKPDSIDLITLGDSESLCTFNTMQVWKEAGIPSFLLSHAAQFIGETYSELKKALKTQKPKVVLLETHGLVFDTNLAENLGEFVKDELKTAFPIFVYHDKWKTLITGGKPDDGNFFKGYEVRTDCKPFTDGDGNLYATGNEVSVPSSARFYMDRIMKLCRDNDIKLLLYSAPSPVNYSMESHNALEAYAREINVPYIDLNMLNEELGINWLTDTFDQGDHLNLYGSVKATEKLIEFIKENTDLKDRSKESGYSDWNELYKKYEKVVEYKINNPEVKN